MQELLEQQVVAPGAVQEEQLRRQPEPLVAAGLQHALRGDVLDHGPGLEAVQPQLQRLLAEVVDRSAGQANRRGLARASVDYLGEQALELGLHRLEAGTMVENVASQRVLEACGYERFGLAPKLLFLNGAWRDHLLFQKLLHDRPLD